MNEVLKQGKPTLADIYKTLYRYTAKCTCRRRCEALQKAHSRVVIFHCPRCVEEFWALFW